MSRLFDGVDDAVNFSLPLSNYISPSTGTFMCWCYPTANGPAAGNRYALDGIVVDTAGYVGILLGDLSSGGQRIHLYNWDGNDDGVAVTFNLNEWIHIAWRHSGGTLEIFKNGVSAGSVASGDTQNMGGSVRVGRNYDTGQSFQGRIAAVQFWSAALTEGEIRAAMGGRIVRAVSRTLHWEMVTNAASEPDWSGNLRTGTITGATIAPHAPKGPLVSGAFGWLAAIAGAPASLLADRGTFDVTGASASLVLTKVESASPGSYGVTGFATTQLRTHILVADQGAYVLGGVAATTAGGGVNNLDAGSYVPTEFAASTAVGFSTTANASSYAVSGLAATTVRTRTLVADPGSLSVSGVTASTAAEPVMLASSGSYSVTGAAAGTTTEEATLAEVAAYAVSGVSANLIRSFNLTADPGALSIGGVAAVTESPKSMTASPGSISVSGASAGTIQAGRVLDPRAHLRLRSRVFDRLALTA